MKIIEKLLKPIENKEDLLERQTWIKRYIQFLLYREKAPEDRWDDTGSEEGGLFGALQDRARAQYAADGGGGSGIIVLGAIALAFFFLQ